VRDYIHVVDLADAHVKALTYLRQGGESATLNCGYGHGYSVREMLQAVEAANGAPLTIIEAERRAGDPPELVAGAEKVRELLGWRPQYDNLATIAESSLAWERSQLDKPWSND
jgi:UDP-glucose 4-epimerase